MNTAKLKNSWIITNVKHIYVALSFYWFSPILKIYEPIYLFWDFLRRLIMKKNTDALTAIPKKIPARTMATMVPVLLVLILSEKKNPKIITSLTSLSLTLFKINVMLNDQVGNSFLEINQFIWVVMSIGYVLLKLLSLVNSIHNSDMLIIPKFLTNQIAANEIIISMTPYCPTPQHLLHMQKKVNFLSLKTFGESKCPGYLNFLWNYSQTHYSDVKWCTSKWRCAIDERKGGSNNSPPISFHCTIFFIQSMTRKGHFLDMIFVLFSLSNELDEE